MKATAAAAVWPYAHRTVAETDEGEGMKYPKEYEYRGGIKDLAHALGVPVNKIYYWRHSKVIPVKYRAKIRDVLGSRDEAKPAPVEQAAPKLSDIVVMLGRYLKAQGM